ncbi:glycosyltransferase family 4 protein [Salegentibacter sp. HM20]
MKRLLYIGNMLEARGGAPTQIDFLSKKFSEIGFQVRAVSKRRNKALRLFEMLWSIFRQRNSTDLVLIDTYSTSNFWYAVVAGKLCRVLKLPYIPILHGGNLVERLENNPKVSSQFLRNAETNVVPSLYLFENLNQRRIPKLQYIPNAIELENYPFCLRKDLSLKLFWLRAFDGIYNPMMAIKVLEILLKDFPEAELCMVGPNKDGSLQQCKEYAKRKNMPVRFPGRLSKPEWIALSREYDIFLNSSNIDNTPVSIIEAMALGLPVVSTNAGGIPWLVEDQKEALLVNPGDIDAALTAIKRLLENQSLAQQISLNARKRVEAFDWAVVKEMWMDLLK